MTNRRAHATEWYSFGLLNSIAVFAGHCQAGPPREAIAGTFGPANAGRALSPDERAAVVEQMIAEGRL
jgi:hypothetical protein